MKGIRTKLSYRKQSEGGAAAVEFAIIAPVFLLLLFGIISYGYMLGFRQAVSQAAIEAARAGAIKPPSYEGDRVQDARDVISDSLAPFGVDCGQRGVTCTITPGTAPGDPFEVTITHPYRDQPLIHVPGMNFLLPSTVSYTAVIERS